MQDGQRGEQRLQHRARVQQQAHRRTVTQHGGTSTARSAAAHTIMHTLPAGGRGGGERHRLLAPLLQLLLLLLLSPTGGAGLAVLAAAVAAQRLCGRGKGGWPSALAAVAQSTRQTRHSEQRAGSREQGAKEQGWRPPRYCFASATHPPTVALSPLVLTTDETRNEWSGRRSHTDSQPGTQSGSQVSRGAHPSPLRLLIVHQLACTARLDASLPARLATCFHAL